MIRVHIPGFYGSDSGKPRWGDCTIMDDGDETLIIDGYCGVGTTRMIKRLKARGVTSPYLLLSHPHYDHYYGLRKIINDKAFTPKALYCQNPNSLVGHDSDITTNIRVLKTIISEAKKRKIPVIYVVNGSEYNVGEIRFNTYFSKPSYTGNSDAYLNDSSICCWFPDIRYLTTGDAGLDCAKTHNLRPVFIKCGHHGNNCVRTMAKWLKAHGCLYYWDNDYSVNLTDFLMTGREDAIAVGMKVFSIHGDINFVAYGGKTVIYKGGKNYQYECDYTGKSTLKMATIDVIVETLQGKHGNDETRVTSLIDNGWYPSNVQNRINQLVKLIKG